MTHVSRQRQHQRNYPERNSARIAVSEALRTGILIRPAKCSECGRDCFPEGHHPNYLKPLEVVWLCRECHSKIPKSPRRGGRLAPKTLVSDSLFAILLVDGWQIWEAEFESNHVKRYNTKRWREWSDFPYCKGKPGGVIALLRARYNHRPSWETNKDGSRMNVQEFMRMLEEAKS